MYGFVRSVEKDEFMFLVWLRAISVFSVFFERAFIKASRVFGLCL